MQSRIVKWTVVFFEDAHGNKPVAEFLNSLAASERAKAARLIELLQEQGTALKAPYAKPLREGLWELRPSQKVRLIYRLHTDRRCVILHGVYKRTDQMPKKEIDTAARRWAEYLAKH